MQKNGKRLFVIALAAEFLVLMIYNPTIGPGLDTCKVINAQEVLLIHSKVMVGVEWD